MHHFNLNNLINPAYYVLPLNKTEAWKATQTNYR